MDDNNYGVYVVSRSKKPQRNGRARGGAGVLILVLLLLTGGICALVILLPRFVGNQSVAASFAGKTLYLLSTIETGETDQASLASIDVSSRGGAGYIFNDGQYRVVAAVYEREEDAKLLTGVNEGSYYFELIFPRASEKGDVAALKYFTGEWFDAVSNAAGDLERGKITEAAAEYAVAAAMRSLSRLGDDCENAALSRALTACTEPAPGTRSVLSALRYVHIRTVADVYFALSD